MILTCPACATRYLVDARALGERGRQVRCARCAHSWYQAPAEPADEAAAAPVPPAPTAAQTVQPIPPGSNLPALIDTRRRRRSPLGWLALAVVVLVGCAAAVVWRETVVRAWPPSGRLYHVLRLPLAADAEARFNLLHLVSERGVSAGRPVLKVSGEVVNIGPAAGPPPALRLALKDRNARALRQWTERLEGGPLAPGQGRAFTAELADPPAEAVSLSVSLGADG